jgi:hypothetical protein
MLRAQNRNHEARHQNETAGLLADCHLRLLRYSRNTAMPMPTAVAELPRPRGEPLAQSYGIRRSGFLIKLHRFASYARDAP